MTCGVTVGCMAAFDADAGRTHPADYDLLVDGFVHLFHRPDVLDDTVALLEGLGYDVVRVAAVAWTGEGDLHRDLAAALDFPAHYGNDLDALDDCLGDVVAYDYATSRDATGFALVLTGYDHFAARQPVVAHTMLDIFATRARSGALIGHRMICLVQSDDPQLSLDPVGAQPVRWSHADGR
jgi:hypothetical protein